MQSLITLTPPAHPDYGVLKSLAQQIVSTKNIIPAKMEENFQLIFSIQRSFVGDFVLAKENSYFITDGQVYTINLW